MCHDGVVRVRGVGLLLRYVLYVACGVLCALTDWIMFLMLATLHTTTHRGT